MNNNNEQSEFWYSRNFSCLLCILSFNILSVVLYKATEVEIYKLCQANAEILVSYSRNPRLGMTPLPSLEGTGIHAGRCAATASSKEEASTGD